MLGILQYRKCQRTSGQPELCSVPVLRKTLNCKLSIVHRHDAKLHTYIHHTPWSSGFVCGAILYYGLLGLVFGGAWSSCLDWRAAAVITMAAYTMWRRRPIFTASLSIYPT